MNKRRERERGVECAGLVACSLFLSGFISSM
jgi:hypothetical protein